MFFPGSRNSPGIVQPQKTHLLVVLDGAGYLPPDRTDRRFEAAAEGDEQACNEGSGSPNAPPTVHQDTTSPGDVREACHERLERCGCRNTVIFNGQVDDLESAVPVCVEEGLIILALQFLPGQQDYDDGHGSLMEIGAERFEAVRETGFRFRFEAVCARGTGRIHETIAHLDFDYAHRTSHPHDVHHALLLEVLKRTLPVLVYTESAMGVITVDLTVRLPDIDRPENVPAEFDTYGRFAILSNGSLWHGPCNASHPHNTRDGFYWARSGDTIYLSPRGSLLGWPDIMTDQIILWLLTSLHLGRKYRQVRVVRG